jgi:hypothetical protein
VKQQHANNELVQEVSSAEAMRQTTLTQCYAPPPVHFTAPPAPPVAPAAAPADAALRMVEIDGQQYLINDATGKVHVVPQKAAASAKKARSLSPVDLSRDSYEESHVTPTRQTIKNKRTAMTSATYALSVDEEDSEDSDEILHYVPLRRNKKSKPASSSQQQQVSEVQVLLEREVDVDVDDSSYEQEQEPGHSASSSEERKQTGHSGSKLDVSDVSDGSKTLLGDDDE